MKVNDAIVGAFLLAFGIAVIAVAQSFPPMLGQPYGAATFPRLIGAAFVLLALIMIAAGAGTWRETGGVRLYDWGRAPGSWLRLLIVIGLVVVYILFSEDFGFVVMGAITLFGLLVTFGTRPLTAILVVVPAILVIQQAFGVLLRVPLPRGVLSPWLW